VAKWFATVGRVAVEGYPRLLGEDGVVAEMNCEELVEKVTDFLDDALSPSDQSRWDDHVDVCLGCQAHLGEVRITLQVVSRLATARLSQDLEDSLLATYRQWADSVSA
jgi:hypothetical protein